MILNYIFKYTLQHYETNESDAARRKISQCGGKKKFKNTNLMNHTYYNIYNYMIITILLLYTTTTRTRSYLNKLRNENDTYDG